MVGYLLQRVTWEAIEVEPGEVVSVSEAMDLLGVSMSAVLNLLNTGRLPTIIDDEEPPTAHGRPHRLTLRAAVEALAREREGGGDE